MSFSREQVIRIARGYLGVRFQHQGRTRNGLDCLGLLIRVGQDIGYTDFDFTAYDRTPDGEFFLQEMCRHLHLIPVEQAQPGDVLLMRYFAFPQHVAFISGVLAEGWKVIHAFNQRGVIEHDLDRRWLDSNRAKIFGAFSLFKPEEIA